MPNLINNPGNVSNALAQNYRRTQVSVSRFGTRTIQFYEIHIYGLSDAVANALDDGHREIWKEGNDDVDQPVTWELAGGHIVEAIIRGVQVMGEVYIVGAYDTNYEEPNYNDLIITVGVAADTVESLWEQLWDTYNTVNYNPHATSLINSIGDSVDLWASDNNTYWDGIDVYPAFLVGDYTDTYGPFALNRNDPAVQGLRAAKKAAREAAPKSGFAPKMKRPS